MEESVFEQEAQALISKDRIDLFDKQLNEMQDVLHSFKNAKLATGEDEATFFARLQQSKLHHDREFTELVFDIADILKDLPEFSSFFKKWIKDSKESDDKKRRKFYALVRTDKIELIRKLSVLMQIFAKTLNNYSINMDIFWTGVVKLHGKARAAPRLTISEKEIKGMRSAGRKRAYEVVVEGKDRAFISERDGISRGQLRAEISQNKPKFMKKPILVSE